ncbi:hypothetical protein [Cupriavidus sp. D39]|uniref:hypothetical protein n=1 Tax=Cupriavidus sp. D39 TaxID=2997877 RepID=UPI00226E67AE|nr:hypothetical protein [Cupriavidus sp. D39]MCY0858777.1 hypothetical protein [Cupriavidus sp. D39]
MTQATMNQTPTIVAWLVRCIVAIALASAWPLSATLAARALGWFSPAAHYDIFAHCVASSLLAGVALTYNWAR